jgi:MATE family multidrug resistance protein
MTQFFRHPSGPAAPWWRETRATAVLAAPLALTQLAYMAILTTDTVMMGWLGPDSLAAGVLAGHLYLIVGFSALGILFAVGPILSQHLGARRFRQVRPTMRQGFWAALVLALPCLVALWHAAPILVFLGQDPGLAAASQSYLRLMAFGFVPSLWGLVLNEFLAAHLRPRPTLVVVTLGIAVNGAADYAFMFGHFGLPRMGLDGAGVASASVNVFMFSCLMAFVLIDRRLRRYRLLGRFWRVDWPQLKEIVRVGLPIAVSELAEIGMFFVAALLMGLIGTATLAAYAVAAQCASIIFTVPLGIALAAAVRVGRAAGAGDQPGVARAGWTAVTLGLGLAVLPAAAFVVLGQTIAGFFLDAARPEDRVVIDLAVTFLALVGLFHLVDAVQVIALGALRGLKDTRVPMLIALAGYWGLGLPLAALFGVYLEFGGAAIWLGLNVGLATVGLLLVLRFWSKTRLQAGR